MNNSDIRTLYRFIKEINKYKSVERLALVKEHGRRESDAEHAWHLAISTWVFSQLYEKPLDLLKVLKLSLVHDLVELYAGDVYAFDTTKREGKEEREQASMQKIKHQLPGKLGEEIENLWVEYENKSSEEAHFVWAMDKIMPRISWILSKGDPTDSMPKDHIKAEDQKKKLKEISDIFTQLLDLLEIDRQKAFANKQAHKIYITASYQGADNKEEIENLCSLVRQAGFTDFCFIRDVEHYQHVFDNPKELMKRSLEELLDCDFLLIDMTNKPTGRAYEAGMAYTLNKKVIGIMKKGTKVKNTTRGIADIIIEYEEIADIVQPLKTYLSGIG